MIKRTFTIGGVILLLLLAIAAGIFFRYNVPDCGLAQFHSLSDIPQTTVTLDYAWGTNPNDADGITENDFGTEEKWDSIDSAPIIAIVNPTGNFCQTEGSIGQEFIIQDVIRGAELIDANQIGMAYCSFGFYPRDTIVFRNTLNIMNPDHEYLIFLEPSPLNDYQDKPAYLLASNLFGYIRRDDCQTPTLGEDYEKYDFLELLNYEFFSVSDPITNTLNTIRKEIRARYL